MRIFTISIILLLIIFTPLFAKMQCPECGKIYPDKYKFCEDDGTPLEKTTDIIWRYEVGSNVISSPYVIGERVYFGSQDYYIYCLNADNSSLIWRYKTGGYVDSSPYVIEGRIYGGSGDNYIYCLSADSGNLIWRYKTGSWVFSSPFVLGGRVYIGSSGGYIYCFSSDNGSLFWKYSINIAVESYSFMICGYSWTGKGMYSSPYVYNGKVYIGSSDGYIYCFSE